MRHAPLLAALVLTLSIHVGGIAQTDAAPGGVAALLELGAGARPLGMGGAFTALADGVEAPLYNPAGLAWAPGSRAGGFASTPFGALTHLVHDRPGDAIQKAGTALARWSQSGFTLLHHLGATLTQLSAPGALETNAFGNPTGRTLDYASRAGVAGFGVELLPSLALGAALKLYGEASGDVSGFGWALDPAVLYAAGGLRLGAVWRNAANDPIAFSNGYAEPWTEGLTLGAAWHARLRRGVLLTLAADAEGVLGEAVDWHLGAELWLERLGLRAGWDRNAFTAGASVRDEGLSVDWGYAFHPTLPQTLRLSAAWAF